MSHVSLILSLCTGVWLVFGEWNQVVFGLLYFTSVLIDWYN